MRVKAVGTVPSAAGRASGGLTPGAPTRADALAPALAFSLPLAVSLPLAFALSSVFALVFALTPGAATAQTQAPSQAVPTVLKPSATLGPAAPSPDKPGQAPRGAQGGTLAPGAAASGPPVFSHRGLPNRFRSVAQAETVLFDAPSDKARKIYIAPAGMPVEVISVLRDWVKFRDVQGDLSWVNRDLLTDRRMVITRAPETLRREPRAEAEPLVDVAADVLLELVDDKPTGEFARVRDAGGEIGFLPVASVWGL